MFKLLVHIITVSVLFVCSSYAVVVEVPPARGNNDIVVQGPTAVRADESTLFSFIQFINKYLRLGLGLVAMIILVYGGVKLMTAQGDSDKMKQATNLLVGAGVGIGIVIFSYAVVRLLVNLL